jgi:translation initiation factor IF-3
MEKIKKDKTIKISPQISEHDLSYRIVQAKKFIDKGHKVKFEMAVHGRSRYTDMDYQLVLRNTLAMFKPINVWGKSHKYYFYTNKYNE